MRVLKTSITGIACFSIASTILLASEHENVIDIQLQHQGTLQGHVVDSQGRPVDTHVAILKNGNLVSRTTTDQRGAFSITGLRGGVFQIKTQRGVGVYRLWTPNTAPPMARASLMLVDGPVVRGQLLGGASGAGGGLLGNAALSPAITTPAMVAGMIATAVAVPVATDSLNAS